MNESCKTCRFFRERMNDARFGGGGSCRRYPPSKRELPEVPFDLHPLVMASDWCGEYRPLPASKEPEIND